MDRPSTLAALLCARAEEQVAEIGFLNHDGHIVKARTYAQLYADAREDSQRLLSAGIQRSTDTVIMSFAAHELHVRLFWACCLGRSQYSLSDLPLF